MLQPIHLPTEPTLRPSLTPGMLSRPPVDESSPSTPSPEADGELREVFNDFVGQTFYGQLLSAMRSTQGKPAYFHGGRGEEIFTAQLDQVLAEKMSEASADQFTQPLFNLFTLARR
jgi:hypothetical protein